MNAGILTFATGANYQQQAFCLALTAKKVLGLPTTVAVDEIEYAPLYVAANVVKLPRSYAGFQNEKLAYEVSPYDITYKMDADMLIPAGTEFYHPSHLHMASGVACSLNGEPNSSVAYRKVESALGLPTIYSALFSFDRSAESEEFWERVKHAFQNWYSLKMFRLLRQAGLPDTLPPTTDSVMSVAWYHLMGSNRVDGNRFIHMKPAFHGWNSDNWVSEKHFVFDSAGRVFVDGIRVSTAFHYYDKSLVTENLTRKVRNVCSVQAPS